MVFFLLGSVFLALFPARGVACPFCSPVEGKTLVSHLDTAHTAVIAKVSRPPLPLEEQMRLRLRDREAAKKATMTEFEIVDHLKGEKNWAQGTQIALPLRHSMSVGQVYLLVQREGAPTPWQIAGILSPDAIAFTKAMAAFPPPESGTWGEGQLERLKVAFRYLDSPEKELSRSAYAEFSVAPYDTVEKLEPLLDDEQLQAWIKNGATAPENRRLYCLLLGICGDDDDREFLKAHFEERHELARSQELAVVLAAWLNLAGKDGLEEVERRFLAPGEVGSSERKAAVEALRFHYAFEDTIEKTRLLESARLLLAHPRSADYIIANLAEWKDWESLDEILALWNLHGAESPWLKQHVRAYLEACPLEGAKTALAAITETNQ